MTPQLTLQRLLVVLTLLSLIAVGCSIPTESAARPIAADDVPEILRPLEPVTTSTTIPAPEPGVAVQVFFVRQGDPTVLVPVTRQATESTAEAALEALFAADPTPEEQEDGLTTFFGPATLGEELITLLKAQFRGNRLFVDLSQLPGIEGELRPVPWSQMVFTATQAFRGNATFERIRFQLEGEPVSAEAEEGLVLPNTFVTRASYPSLAPNAAGE
ncbi:MAG: GerMN domain-containing protein [Acidimicrobiales bacterium]